jgi:glycosyltransferase involved in cell wall biosynthesis
MSPTNSVSSAGAIERPRVLHYLSSSAWGGAEEHALSLLEAMPDHGLIPYLAASPRLLETMGSRLAAFGSRYIAIERNSIRDWRHGKRFWNFLKSERIDLVHSHLFVASLFASPLARMARVPAVVETFHLREAWREGHWLKGSFWIDRQISRFVDRYIAVSQAAELHLIENKRIVPSKIVKIYNGRDLTHFAPPSNAAIEAARSELSVTGKQVVMVLGRLEPQKGHVFLIEALKTLAPRWPKLVALFAGTGALEAELKAQVSAAGLADRITFLGQRDDTVRLLAAADMVVLPSLFEGLPLVAVEALAMARPMVATNVEGTREIIADGDTGILVRPSDPTALAVGIERILADPSLGAQLGARSRRLVERNFDVQMQIAATVRLYRTLLEKGQIRVVNRKNELRKSQNSPTRHGSLEGEAL